MQFSGSAPAHQAALNALPFRDRPMRPPVPVRARIVWEHDGETWLDGQARRLDPGLAIFVEIRDKRCQFTGLWLAPDDVWWEGK